MTLHVQFATMFTMIAGGFYLGLAKDTLRRFSRLWEGRTFFAYGIEISFWLMNTSILFYLLYLVNAGELRLIIFIACFFGYAMYQALASNIYKRLLEVCIRWATTCFRWITKVVSLLFIRPIRAILRFVKKCILSLLLLIGTIGLFLLRILYLPIKWFGKGVYQLLPEKISKKLPKREQICSIIKNISKKWKSMWGNLRR